jgi:uncharacterized protein YecE (DUF72 family)
MKIRRLSSSTLPLFADAEKRTSEYVQKNRERIQRWASKGILFGSSSWKYPGWKGTVYNNRYPTQKAFNSNSLEEYSQLFPTVCADFALYDFPDPGQMRIIHDQTTDNFKLSLKVTDRITIKRYPSLPRFGENAGRENPDFLNINLFQESFLKPIEALKKKRGVIIFEFSTFHQPSGVSFKRFTELIDRFLSQLPKGYEYAVEIRNREFLTSEYLKLIASHEVAHVLNNWTRMPSIIEQIQLAGILTAPFSVARALLKTGRTYEQAVGLFQPYDRVKEELPDLRAGLVETIRNCLDQKKSLYAYVNNRAEGNSPKTIEGILDMLDKYPAEKL